MQASPKERRGILCVSHFFRLFSVLSALLVIISSDAMAGQQLTWTGCGITKKAFMAEIARAYQRKTGTAIQVTGGGATKGIRFVASKKADMGGTCRSLLHEKNGQIHQAEQNTRLVQVAWDALVVIVHPLNPVQDISLQNLKRVFDGTITSWKDLGGADTPIALITREGTQGKHSGVGYMFRELVFHDANYAFKAPTINVQSTGPLENKIEKIVFALGMDGISSARKSKVKMLSLNGVYPAKKMIMSAHYPLFRPLYIAIHKNPSAQVQRVLDFMLSREGQAIISRQGTVNLKEGEKLGSLWRANHPHEDSQRAP